VNLGRVLGANLTTIIVPVPITGDNYALANMEINSSAVPYDTALHGTRKSNDDFKISAVTWRNGLGFNLSSLTSVLPWNLTSAGSLGYPTLTGLGGQ
jgi:hypothetical protein